MYDHHSVSLAFKPMDKLSTLRIIVRPEKAKAELRSWAANWKQRPANFAIAITSDNLFKSTSIYFTRSAEMATPSITVLAYRGM